MSNSSFRFRSSSSAGSSWISSPVAGARNRPSTVPPDLSNSPLAILRSPVITPFSRSRTVPPVTTTSPSIRPRTSRSPSTRMSVPSSSSPASTTTSSPILKMKSLIGVPSSTSASPLRAPVLLRRAARRPSSPLIETVTSP